MLSNHTLTLLVLYVPSGSELAPKTPMENIKALKANPKIHNKVPKPPQQLLLLGVAAGAVALFQIVIDRFLYTLCKYAKCAGTHKHTDALCRYL